MYMAGSRAAKNQRRWKLSKNSSERQDCAIDLSEFDNRFFDPGRGFLVRVMWFLFGLPLLRCALIPSSRFRLALLRAFGAEIGEGAVMQHNFSVKYPWNLVAGRNCWFGEDSWLDNLSPITLGSNVCISQGAYLCTGNHDWSDPSFGLIVAGIQVRDGAWIGAHSLVAPGVVIGECAVTGLGAVVTRSVPAFEIHAGNPAKFVRLREIKKTELRAETVAHF